MKAPIARDKQHREQKRVHEIGGFCYPNLTANIPGSIAEGSGFDLEMALKGFLIHRQLVWKAI